MLRALLLTLLPLPVLADPPRVVTDIAPVHSLVASVMQGVGAPELLLPPGASPHGHALRPAQAQALSQADLVIWVGPELTPWLVDAVRNLAEKATPVALLAAPGTRLRHYGDGASSKNGHADDGSNGHGHASDGAPDKVARDDHADGHDHSAHGGNHDDAEGGHGHEHGHGGEVDPHAWLDPANGVAWLAAIAEALAVADPANAAVYRANAAGAAAALTDLSAGLEARLATSDTAFVLYHDGYGYFQAAFSVRPLAVVADGDARRPGAARLAEVRSVLSARPGACVLLEPQIPARAALSIVEGTGARLGTLDPLGAEITPGPELYGAILTGIARTIGDCQ